MTSNAHNYKSGIPELKDDIIYRIDTCKCGTIRYSERDKKGEWVRVVKYVKGGMEFDNLSEPIRCNR